MFSQILIMLIGCYLFFMGMQDQAIINIVLGLLLVFIPCERLYHLKTGKANFGLTSK